METKPTDISAEIETAWIEGDSARLNELAALYFASDRPTTNQATMDDLTLFNLLMIAARAVSDAMIVEAITSPTIQDIN